MTAGYDDLITCYRSGQIPEAVWQRHLAEDEGLRRRYDAVLRAEQFGTDVESEAVMDETEHRFSAALERMAGA